MESGRGTHHPLTAVDGGGLDVSPSASRIGVLTSSLRVHERFARLMPWSAPVKGAFPFSGRISDWNPRNFAPEGSFLAVGRPRDHHAGAPTLNSQHHRTEATVS